MQYIAIAKPSHPALHPRIVTTHSSIEGVRDLVRLDRQATNVEHLKRYEVVSNNRLVEVIDPMTGASSLPPRAKR
jgi:hypothetical protein